MDDTTAIVQFRHNDIDVGATVESYAEAIKQQGFPEVHAQLLEELRAWCEAEAGDEGALAPTIERVLEVEAEVLEDASVAGVAAEHLPFLYTVVGQVFKTGGPAFQKALLRQARQAEQAYEEAIRQHMRETDCDRLVAVQYMESVALERLQERDERLRDLVASHLA
jgi:hypothetical protein